MSYRYKPYQSSGEKKGRQWLRFALGVIALITGSLVYLVDRPADTSYLIPESLSLFDNSISLFGAIGSYLPTFSHVFAFILITAALSPARHSSYLLICGAWLVIDCLFELAQHTTISQYILSSIPTIVADISFLNHVLNYLHNGRYDPVDMLSITIGVIAAYAVLLMTEKQHQV